MPELLKFLPKESVSDKRILDLGCGTGFFLKEYLSHAGNYSGPAKSLGVDIDTELIVLAKENCRKEVEDDRVSFLVQDATSLKMLGESSFDVVLSIESAVNIADFKKFSEEVSRVLSVGGRFVLVVNHPAFRIPQASDWHFDKEKVRQGRVVYKYKTPHKILIDMNPGTKQQDKKIYTTTFHRPFEEYFNTLTRAGLRFVNMKEISSVKISQNGPRKKIEDYARQEIPMFLFLEFTK